ncbi:hypothetical protein HDV04_005607 [Boothiomyces sp. JEL0838]|nr:hypothetical protein HDV04_005607 [Boothiomyces sp. JEL0838]
MDHQIAISLLEPYSSCDISDALCKLIHLNIIGHFPRVVSYSPKTPVRIAGPAYTVEFVLTSNAAAPKAKMNHVDTAPPGSIIVIKAHRDAPNAVWGGLMTARAKSVGVKGAVIDGNIRDIAELHEFDFPVWASGQSTMGAAPFCRPTGVTEPITIGEATPWPVVVKTGDIIVADEDGVVRIPLEHVELVAKECKLRVEMDKKCMHDIKNGSTIVDAFAKHRK